MPTDHITRGYAIVDLSYALNSTKKEDARYTPPYKPTKEADPNVRTTLCSEVWTMAVYSKCPKNKTHHTALSKWYTERVRQEVAVVIQKEIARRNKQSADRVKKWKADMKNGLIKGGDGRPSEYQYDEFDENNLMKKAKPYPSENEPAEHHGLEIEW